MEATGLIVEYNPFHNGHALHLQKARELAPDAVMAAVMSGDYVQRGEPALLPKEKRADLAIAAGVDLVAELPPFYSTQTAEIFAWGAVGILGELGCGRIVFGSECNDRALLGSVAARTETVRFREKLRQRLKEGLSFPKAYALALETEASLEANDILGVEYIRAARAHGKPMALIPVKRIERRESSADVRDGITSSSEIRARIAAGDYDNAYVPEETARVLMNSGHRGLLVDLNACYPLLRYRILSDPGLLGEIQDMEEGFENRLAAAAKKHQAFPAFFEAVRTKRYTAARTQRILIHALLGLTKAVTAAARTEIPYVRVLRYNERGRSYLNALKKTGNEKILTTWQNCTRKFSGSRIDLINFSRKSEIFYHMIWKEQ
ncbi:MAG: nucleotidyltransferase family protein [Fusobacteriaceae bacterium]|jgi:predicted nucleotidyltransferase|nr:nucleotidyltransferase family protein [Fusobacteriaceae bacterium]